MKFGIIGYGRFGRLWADILSVQGEVFVYDKNLSQTSFGGSINLTSLAEAVAVDILFLLVPISEMENVCKEVAPLLSPDTIVLDASSVKVYPAKVLPDNLPAGQPIILTHPLFGPDSVKKSGLKDKKIVMHAVVASAEQTQTIKKIFDRMGIKTILATPEEHDKQMATSQALVHFLGRALAGLNLETQEISTPDYESLLKINDLVENDTWQLFVDMQKYNPYAQAMRQKLISELTRIDQTL